MKKFLLALCLVVLVAAPAVFAQGTAVKTAPVAARPAPDEVTFTNGDHLSGELVRGTGGSIVFKSEMAGELTIPLDKIKELRSNKQFVVLRKAQPVTRTPAKAGSVFYADGSITLGESTSTPEVIPATDAAYVIDDATYEKQISRQAGFLTGWSGAATAGATFVRSTTNGETFTAGVALVRAIPTVPYLPPRNRTTFDLVETYGKLTTPLIPPTTPATPASTVKTSIFHTDAERDEYVSKRLYVLATVDFDHNFSQGLDLQQLYGVGVGFTAIQDAKQELDLHLDGHYERQNFTPPGVNQNLVGMTVAEAYKRSLPYKLAFTESANYIPAFNNTNAYAANFAAGISLPAWKKLSVNFTTTDNYLNDPAPFYNKNSFQFVTGLSYAIH
jgi:hypothetical protein